MRPWPGCIHQRHPPSVATSSNPRKPSHTPRLATHLQSPAPDRTGRTVATWRSRPRLTLSAGTYTRASQSALAEPASASPLAPPASPLTIIEVYFFTTTIGAPPTSQHFTSTRRPANLEISVLPSRRLSLPSLPTTCRRSPSSLPRTRGHVPQPLNGYAIIRHAYNSSNVVEFYDA